MTPFDVTDSTGLQACTGLSTAKLIDPQLKLMPTAVGAGTKFFDPRPVSGGNSYQDVDSVPNDPFYTSVGYKGAFAADSDFWLVGLSYLDDIGMIPDDVTGTFIGEGIATSGSGVTLSGSPSWSGNVIITKQVFVPSGVTLTIAAGTTIYGYKDDGSGGTTAPSLVIERGGTLMAEGTASQPITFTAACSSKSLPSAGNWGGLIILGNAPGHCLAS